MLLKHINIKQTRSKIMLMKNPPLLNNKYIIFTTRKKYMILIPDKKRFEKNNTILVSFPRYPLNAAGPVLGILFGQ